MNLIAHAAGAFGAVVTLSLVFCVPRRFLVRAGLVGAAGWCLYQALLGAGSREMPAMFASAMLAAIVSHLFARRFKAPVTIFLVPGILPLVPGVGMYRIAYAVFQEDGAAASRYLFYTLQIAAMIAIAIFITDTLFKILWRPRR